uniref:PDZ domain-containing protein n=2 Tax=Leptobrachium leishanense TaxID=445787 RepID=A0A8C5QK92_9ANUR
MCDCFHLFLPNWQGSPASVSNKPLKPEEPDGDEEEDDTSIDMEIESVRPRPQGSSPVYEYAINEYNMDTGDSSQYADSEHSSSIRKTSFIRTSHPFTKMSDLEEPMEVTLNTEVDICASGFTIVGGGQEGITVSQVLKESTHSNIFCVKEGDQLLSATIYFDNITHEDALRILQHSEPYRVQFELKRKLGKEERIKLHSAIQIKKEKTTEGEDIAATLEKTESSKTVRKREHKKKRSKKDRISWPKFQSITSTRFVGPRRSRSTSETNEEDTQDTSSKMTETFYDDDNIFITQKHSKQYQQRYPETEIHSRKSRVGEQIADVKSKIFSEPYKRIKEKRSLDSSVNVKVDHHDIPKTHIKKDLSLQSEIVSEKEAGKIKDNRKDKISGVEVIIVKEKNLPSPCKVSPIPRRDQSTSSETLKTQMGTMEVKTQKRLQHLEAGSQDHLSMFIDVPHLKEEAEGKQGKKELYIIDKERAYSVPAHMDNIHVNENELRGSHSISHTKESEVSVQDNVIKSNLPLKISETDGVNNRISETGNKIDPFPGSIQMPSFGISEGVEPNSGTTTVQEKTTDQQQEVSGWKLHMPIIKMPKLPKLHRKSFRSAYTKQSNLESENNLERVDYDGQNDALISGVANHSLDIKSGNAEPTLLSFEDRYLIDSKIDQCVLLTTDNVTPTLDTQVSGPEIPYLETGKSTFPHDGVVLDLKTKYMPIQYRATIQDLQNDQPNKESLYIKEDRPVFPVTELNQQIIELVSYEDIPSEETKTLSDEQNKDIKEAGEIKSTNKDGSYKMPKFKVPSFGPFTRKVPESSEGEKGIKAPSKKTSDEIKDTGEEDYDSSIVIHTETEKRFDKKSKIKLPKLGVSLPKIQFQSGQYIVSEPEHYSNGDEIQNIGTFKFISEDQDTWSDDLDRERDKNVSGTQETDIQSQKIREETYPVTFPHFQMPTFGLVKLSGNDDYAKSETEDIQKSETEASVDEKSIDLPVSYIDIPENYYQKDKDPSCWEIKKPLIKIPVLSLRDQKTDTLPCIDNSVQKDQSDSFVEIPEKEKEKQTSHFKLPTIKLPSLSLTISKPRSINIAEEANNQNLQEMSQDDLTKSHTVTKEIESIKTNIIQRGSINIGEPISKSKIEDYSLQSGLNIDTISDLTDVSSDQIKSEKVTRHSTEIINSLHKEHDRVKTDIGSKITTSSKDILDGQSLIEDVAEKGILEEEKGVSFPHFRMPKFTAFLSETGDDSSGDLHEGLSLNVSATGSTGSVEEPQQTRPSVLKNEHPRVMPILEIFSPFKKLSAPNKKASDIRSEGTCEQSLIVEGNLETHKETSAEKDITLSEINVMLLKERGSPFVSEQYTLGQETAQKNIYQDMSKSGIENYQTQIETEVKHHIIDIKGVDLDHEITQGKEKNKKAILSQMEGSDADFSSDVEEEESLLGNEILVSEEKSVEKGSLSKIYLKGYLPKIKMPKLEIIKASKEKKTEIEYSQEDKNYDKGQIKMEDTMITTLSEESERKTGKMKKHKKKNTRIEKLARSGSGEKVPSKDISTSELQQLTHESYKKDLAYQTENKITIEKQETEIEPSKEETFVKFSEQIIETTEVKQDSSKGESSVEDEQRVKESSAWTIQLPSIKLPFFSKRETKAKRDDSESKKIIHKEESKITILEKKAEQEVKEEPITKSEEIAKITDMKQEESTIEIKKKSVATEEEPSAKVIIFPTLKIPQFGTFEFKREDDSPDVMTDTRMAETQKEVTEIQSAKTETVKISTVNTMHISTSIIPGLEGASVDSETKHTDEEMESSELNVQLIEGHMPLDTKAEKTDVLLFDIKDQRTEVRDILLKSEVVLIEKPDVKVVETTQEQLVFNNKELVLPESMNIEKTTMKETILIQNEEESVKNMEESKVQGQDDKETLEEDDLKSEETEKTTTTEVSVKTKGKVKKHKKKIARAEKTIHRVISPQDETVSPIEEKDTSKTDVTLLAPQSQDEITPKNQETEHERRKVETSVDFSKLIIEKTKVKQDISTVEANVEDEKQEKESSAWTILSPSIRLPFFSKSETKAEKDTSKSKEIIIEEESKITISEEKSEQEAKEESLTKSEEIAEINDTTQEESTIEIEKRSVLIEEEPSAEVITFPTLNVPQFGTFEFRGEVDFVDSPDIMIETGTAKTQEEVTEIRSALTETVKISKIKTMQISTSIITDQEGTSVDSKEDIETSKVETPEKIFQTTEVKQDISTVEASVEDEKQVKESSAWTIQLPLVKLPFFSKTDTKGKGDPRTTKDILIEEDSKIMKSEDKAEPKAKVESVAKSEETAEVSGTKQEESTIEIEKKSVVIEEPSAEVITFPTMKMPQFGTFELISEVESPDVITETGTAESQKEVTETQSALTETVKISTVKTMHISTSIITDKEGTSVDSKEDIETSKVETPVEFSEQIIETTEVKQDISTVEASVGDEKQVEESSAWTIQMPSVKLPFFTKTDSKAEDKAEPEAKEQSLTKSDEIGEVSATKQEKSTIEIETKSVVTEEPFAEVITFPTMKVPQFGTFELISEVESPDIITETGTAESQKEVTEIQSALTETVKISTVKTMYTSTSIIPGLEGASVDSETKHAEEGMESSEVRVQLIEEHIPLVTEAEETDVLAVAKEDQGTEIQDILIKSEVILIEKPDGKVVEKTQEQRTSMVLPESLVIEKTTSKATTPIQEEVDRVTENEEIKAQEEDDEFTLEEEELKVEETEKTTPTEESIKTKGKVKKHRKKITRVEKTVHRVNSPPDETASALIEKDVSKFEVKLEKHEMDVKLLAPQSQDDIATENQDTEIERMKVQTSLEFSKQIIETTEVKEDISTVVVGVEDEKQGKEPSAWTIQMPSIKFPFFTKSEAKVEKDTSKSKEIIFEESKITISEEKAEPEAKEESLTKFEEIAEITGAKQKEPTIEIEKKSVVIELEPSAEAVTFPTMKVPQFGTFELISEVDSPDIKTETGTAESQKEVTEIQPALTKTVKISTVKTMHISTSIITDQEGTSVDSKEDIETSNFQTPVEFSEEIIETIEVKQDISTVEASVENENQVEVSSAWTSQLPSVKLPFFSTTDSKAEGDPRRSKEIIIEEDSKIIISEGKAEPEANEESVTKSEEIAEITGTKQEESTTEIEKKSVVIKLEPSAEAVTFPTIKVSQFGTFELISEVDSPDVMTGTGTAESQKEVTEIQSAITERVKTSKVKTIHISTSIIPGLEGASLDTETKHAEEGMESSELKVQLIEGHIPLDTKAEETDVLAVDKEDQRTEVQDILNKSEVVLIEKPDVKVVETTQEQQTQLVLPESLVIEKTTTKATTLIKEEVDRVTEKEEIKAQEEDDEFTLEEEELKIEETEKTKPTEESVKPKGKVKKHRKKITRVEKTVHRVISPQDETVSPLIEKDVSTFEVKLEKHEMDVKLLAPQSQDDITTENQETEIERRKVETFVEFSKQIIETAEVKQDISTVEASVEDEKQVKESSAWTFQLPSIKFPFFSKSETKAETHTRKSKEIIFEEESKITISEEKAEPEAKEESVTKSEETEEVTETKQEESTIEIEKKPVVIELEPSGEAITFPTIKVPQFGTFELISEVDSPDVMIEKGTAESQKEMTEIQSAITERVKISTVKTMHISTSIITEQEGTSVDSKEDIKTSKVETPVEFSEQIIETTEVKQDISTVEASVENEKQVEASSAWTIQLPSVKLPFFSKTDTKVEDPRTSKEIIIEEDSKIMILEDKAEPEAKVESVTKSEEIAEITGTKQEESTTEIEKKYVVIEEEPSAEAITFPTIKVPQFGTFELKGEVDLVDPSDVMTGTGTAETQNEMTEIQSAITETINISTDKTMHISTSIITEQEGTAVDSKQEIETSKVETPVEFSEQIIETTEVKQDISTVEARVKDENQIREASAWTVQLQSFKIPLFSKTETKVDGYSNDSKNIINEKESKISILEEKTDPEVKEEIETSQLETSVEFSEQITETTEVKQDISTVEASAEGEKQVKESSAWKIQMPSIKFPFFSKSDNKAERDTSEFKDIKIKSDSKIHILEAKIDLEAESVTKSGEIAELSETKEEESTIEIEKKSVVIVEDPSAEAITFSAKKIPRSSILGFTRKVDFIETPDVLTQIGTPEIQKVVTEFQSAVSETVQISADKTMHISTSITTDLEGTSVDSEEKADRVATEEAETIKFATKVEGDTSEYKDIRIEESKVTVSKQTPEISTKAPGGKESILSKKIAEILDVLQVVSTMEIEKETVAIPDDLSAVTITFPTINVPQFGTSEFRKEMEFVDSQNVLKESGTAETKEETTRINSATTEMPQTSTTKSLHISTSILTDLEDSSQNLDRMEFSSTYSPPSVGINVIEERINITEKGIKPLFHVEGQAENSIDGGVVETNTNTSVNRFKNDKQTYYTSHLDYNLTQEDISAHSFHVQSNISVDNRTSRPKAPRLSISIHEESISIADDEINTIEHESTENIFHVAVNENAPQPVESFIDKDEKLGFEAESHSMDPLKMTAMGDFLIQERTDVTSWDNVEKSEARSSNVAYLFDNTESNKTMETGLEMSPEHKTGRIVFPRYSTPTLSISVREESICMEDDDSVRKKLEFFTDDVNTELASSEERFTVKSREGEADTSDDNKIDSSSSNVVLLSKEDIVHKPDEQDALKTKGDADAPDEKRKSLFKMPAFKIPSLTLMGKKEKSVDDADKTSEKIDTNLPIKKMVDISSAEITPNPEQLTDEIKTEVDTDGGTSILAVVTKEERPKFRMPKFELFKPSTKGSTDRSSVSTEETGNRTVGTEDDGSLVLTSLSKYQGSTDTKQFGLSPDILFEGTEEHHYEEPVKIEFPYFKMPAISVMTSKEVEKQNESSTEDPDINFTSIQARSLDFEKDKTTINLDNVETSEHKIKPGKKTRSGFKLSFLKGKTPHQSSSVDVENIDITAHRETADFVVLDYDLSRVGEMQAADINCVANQATLIEKDLLQADNTGETQQELGFSNDQQQPQQEENINKEAMEANTTTESTSKTITDEDKTRESRKISEVKAQIYGIQSVLDSQVIVSSDLKAKPKELRSESTEKLDTVTKEYEGEGDSEMNTAIAGKVITFSSEIVKQYEITSSETKTPALGFSLLKIKLPEAHSNVNAQVQGSLDSADTLNMEDKVTIPGTEEELVKHTEEMKATQTATATASVLQIESSEQHTTVTQSKDTGNLEASGSEDSSLDPTKIKEESDQTAAPKLPGRFLSWLPSFGSTSVEEAESQKDVEEEQLQEATQSETVPKEKSSWFKLPKLGFSTSKDQNK